MPTWERPIDMRGESDNHGWISVHDHLPELMFHSLQWSESVPCIVDDGSHQYLFAGQYNIVLGEWYDANDHYVLLPEIGDVTHWMQIQYPERSDGA